MQLGQQPQLNGAPPRCVSANHFNVVVTGAAQHCVTVRVGLAQQRCNHALSLQRSRCRRAFSSHQKANGGKEAVAIGLNGDLCHGKRGPRAHLHHCASGEQGGQGPVSLVSQGLGGEANQQLGALCWEGKGLGCLGAQGRQRKAPINSHHLAAGSSLGVVHKFEPQH